jgi:uncharacterized protein YecE (DUF72 family)
MQIHIGTSGWHYAHWRGPFYPHDLASTKMLRWYTNHFDTVEINNSFYRLPTDDALKIWFEQTPHQFCFALKASRYITHRKRLLDPENTVKNFLPRVERLGRKLGPILFQLPPRWRVNLERLKLLLQILPRSHQCAFEFRDPSWHNVAVYSLLRRFNAAFCVFEIAGFQSPTEITADFSYVRLHGPGERAYQGKYTKGQLRLWAQRIAEWQRHLQKVFVYFDNDQAGFAARNAMELKSLVSQQESSSHGPRRAA